jgi:septal ring factor EnvC (AmiA/AmiB activator)
MQIEVTVLLSVIGCCVSVAAFFIGRISAAGAKGQQTGQVLTELGYIKKGVDGLEKRFEKLQENYNELKTRVTKLEEKVGFYHHE